MDNIQNDGESTPEGMDSGDEVPELEVGQPRQTSLADIQMLRIPASGRSGRGMISLEQRMQGVLDGTEGTRTTKHRSVFHSKQREIEAAKDKETKRQRLWDRSVEELVETERKYIQDLDVLKRVFVEPLRASATRSRGDTSGKPLLDPAVVQTIFSDIDIFLQLHIEQFLPGLEKEAADGGTGIGKFFISRASFLKMYTSYLNKYEESCALLHEEEKSNTAFRNFLIKCYAQPDCKNLAITDYLIKPLHRLTRYTLLLKSMATNCKPELQQIREELTTAISKVSQVTTLVNASVRDAENRRKVVSISEELQNMLPDLIQPARRYVMEATFSHYLDGAPGSPVSVFVFNDLVVTSYKRKEFFSTPLDVTQFEISSMLLQVDVDPHNPSLHAFRFFNKDLKTVDMCTTSFEEQMELVDRLVKLRVVVEGAPYSLNREKLDLPRVSLALIGDVKCGKSTFLRTVRDAKRSVCSFSEDSRTGEHHSSSDTYESFVVPFAVRTTPYNLELIDTYS